MEQGNAANNTSFLRELLPLAVPIILQSLFSTAVGLADSFMLNFVGQDELAAVSLANQPQFVLSLFYLGLTSGTGVMMAQYLGKKDSAAIHYIFKFALYLTVSISLVFTVLAVGFPSLVMEIFTNQPALVGIGGSYLRVIGVTYLLSAVSQVYLATLKTHHLVKKSFAFSAATLLLNVFLNAVFIWGQPGGLCVPPAAPGGVCHRKPGRGHQNAHRPAPIRQRQVDKQSDRKGECCMNMEERKANGLLWTDTEEAMAAQRIARGLCFDFNHIHPSQADKRNAMLPQMFGKVGKDVC